MKFNTHHRHHRHASALKGDEFCTNDDGIHYTERESLDLMYADTDADNKFIIRDAAVTSYRNDIKKAPTNPH